MVVPPSFLENSAGDDRADAFGNNITLKLGQVIRVNYPDLDDKNSPQVVSYDLFVNEYSNDGAYTTVYYGCLLSNIFGGLADYCDYVLRPNVSDDSDDQNQLLLSGAPISPDNYNQLLGSTVILACIDGLTNNNVIIGALPHYLNSVVNKNYKIPQKDDGIFLNFNYNGIKVKINGDGELLIERQGPTNADGSLAGETDQEEQDNADKSHSHIRINKDGEILISTTNKDNVEDLSSDDLDNLIIVKKNGNIEIKIDGGKTLELKDKDNNATMILGDGSHTAAVAEELKSLYQQLTSFLKAMTFPSGMGPTGTAINIAQLPEWNSAIESKTLKIPK